MLEKNKKRVIALLASILLAIGVLTQPVAAQENDDTAIDVTFTFLNDYVLRGTSFTYSYQSGPAAIASLLYFQPDIYFQLGHGWWFDIWGSVQLGNKSPIGDDGGPTGGVDYFDEVDFSFGYSGSSRIGDVSVGFLTYAYPNPVYARPSDLELSFSYAGPNSPELSFFWLHTLINRGNVGREGALGRNYMAIKYSKDWDIGNDASFNLKWALGYHILPPSCKGGTDANGGAGDNPDSTSENRQGGNRFQGDLSGAQYCNGATEARSGFSHFDLGIGLAKDFFSWSLTGIYRYRPAVFEGLGPDESYAFGDSYGAGVSSRVHKLIWVTSISFGFGF